MSYRVKIAAGAAREIAKLPQQIAAQVVEVIEALAENPRPLGQRNWMEWLIATGAVGDSIE